MRKRFEIRAVLVVALLGLGAPACVKNTNADGSEERIQYTLTKKAFMHLQRVNEHAEKKEWAEALEELDQMAERKFLNPYERASMWGARAMVLAAKGDLDKIPHALEQALALNAFPDEERLTVEHQLAQAYFVNEKFTKAGDMFAKWLKEAKNPDSSVYYVAASSYAQAKKFKAALPFAKKAVEKMKKTEESWLSLLMSIHYELKQNEEVAAVLKRLIKDFPKKQYWLHLSQTYQTMEQSPKALAVMELAYSKEMLDDEKDFLNLARLQIQQGVPLKAAAVLEAHIADGTIEKKPETLELLATAWLMAENRERAEATLKQAANAASSGELYMRLAQFHVERHEWAKAREAIAEGLKQKLEDPGQAHLLLGIVNYNQKRMDAAMSALNEAKKHEKTAKAAKEWIALVRNERGTASVEGAEGGEAAPAE